MSQSGTPIMRHEAPDMEDPCARRRAWWGQLSVVGFYVREAYLYTPFAESINSQASGNAGQEVVRTKLGTLTWVPSDRRIIVSNTNQVITLS